MTSREVFFEGNGETATVSSPRAFGERVVRLLHRNPNIRDITQDYIQENKTHSTQVIQYTIEGSLFRMEIKYGT